MEIAPEYDRNKGLYRQDDRIAPHEVELIKLRDNRTMLTVKLVTGEELEGAIRWYDDRALRLVQPDRTELTVFRSAIAYYQSKV